MTDRPTTAALATLLILQGVMLLALLFKLPPHPPEVIPIGGMAPVLGVSLSVCVVGMIFGVRDMTGRVFIVLACLLAAVSYGPQKYFDPVFVLVWPAIVTAQIAILALLAQVARAAIASRRQPQPC